MTSPWSLAVGNLAGSTPPATIPTAPRTPKVGRAPVAKCFCPHCGARMRSPQGPRPWSPEEDEQLLALLKASKPYKVIAAELGRPHSSIKSRISTKGLRYPF